MSKLLDWEIPVRTLLFYLLKPEDVESGRGAGARLRRPVNGHIIMAAERHPRLSGGGLVCDAMHGGGGAGRGKARGEDRLDEDAGLVDGADVGDDGFVVGQGGLRRDVAVEVWADGGVVLADAVDEGFLAALEAEACESLWRGREWLCSRQRLWCRATGCG